MLSFIFGLIVGIAFGFYLGVTAWEWSKKKQKHMDKEDVCNKLGVSPEEYDRFLKMTTIDSTETFLKILKERGTKK